MTRRGTTRLTMGKLAMRGGPSSASKSRVAAATYRRVVLPSGTMYFMRADEAAALEWRHLTTPMWRPADGSGSIIGGATVWVATLDNDDVACIAWEWAMVERDVFAIANMLTIESNLYLDAPDGSGPQHKGRLLFLARVIAELKWQEQVAQRCAEHLAFKGENLLER